jgi:hypothetical protein
MEEFNPYNDLEDRFQCFERAAAKGHEESIWILSVVKDVETDEKAVKEAFANGEEPLGWYLAGMLSDASNDRRDEFDFDKKTAEGGCSWGQTGYGWYFRDGGDFVEKDMTVYVEWLEKAVNQNNPRAMDLLGLWFRNEGGDKPKAISYFRCAAELGWTQSMYHLAEMLEDGDGCEIDLRQALIWGTKGRSIVFWGLLGDACRALGSETTEDLVWDFNQLCYTLGWGLYWYRHSSYEWKYQSYDNKVFGERCFDYYCSCAELQQKSIFTFLLCWNRTTGIKGPGQMIAEMVWEGREENLVKQFEERVGKEPETKRIKK